MQLSLTLGVTDLEQSEKFYHGLLGLNVERDDSGLACGAFLLIRCGAVRMVLQPLAVLAGRHPVLRQNLERGHPGTGFQLEFGCPDLAAVLARLKKDRWPLLYELEDHEHLRREVWVQDPDGYLLVLNEEPAALCASLPRGGGNQA